METQKPLLKDEDGEEVDVHMYRLMIGSLMYLTSSRLDIMFAVYACARHQVNPKCKKQTVVANFTTEAEYVAASSCCRQVFWIQNQLLDYGLVRAATTASSLEVEHDSGNITKTRSKATPNESSSLGTTSGGGPRNGMQMYEKCSDIVKMEKLPLDECYDGREVVENESHFSLKIVDQDLSSLAMFTKHLMGGSVGSNFGVGEEKIESIGGIGGGSFAKRSMVAKDGLGGDGFVVDGGRSPSKSRKMRSVVVEEQVFNGSGGGEVNGGGVDLGVSKQFSLELIVVLIGDSGGVVIGEVGGAPDV
ncbi:hypothetical protein Tco_1575515 [Tanacetum coccineum]